MLNCYKPVRARSFTATQYLEHGATLLTSMDVSMACWFYTTDSTTDQTLMGLCRSTAGPPGPRSTELRIGGARVSPVTDPILAYGYNGSAVEALTTDGYKTNCWNHAAAVWGGGAIGTTNLTGVWLNGGGYGGNAANGNGNSSTTRTIIGAANQQGSYVAGFTGMIAWPAFWRGVLREADVIALAAGTPPWLVRPDALLAFYDFECGGDIQFTSNNLYPGAYALTSTNSKAAAGPDFLRSRTTNYAKIYSSVIAAPAGDTRRFVIS